MMYVLFVLLLCGIKQIGTLDSGKEYENALLASLTTTNTSGASAQISMFPVTLVDVTSYTITKTLTFTHIITAILSMKVDYSRQRVYFYDLNTASIYVINNFDWKTNFTDIKVASFYKGVTGDFIRLGLDWVSGNVYWTDPLYGWIAVQNGDSDDTFKILIHDLETPTALTVDPKHRYLFWSDIGLKTVKIERSSLSGSERKTIISTSLLYPSSIDVDFNYNKIIWVDTGRETVEMADFDGSGRQRLRRFPQSSLYDLALFMDLVYVTDVRTPSVYIISKNNGALVSKIQNSNGASFFAAAVYSIEVQPNQNDACALSGCSDICVADGSGPLCMCREGFKLKADNKTCSEDSGKFHRAVVWTNRTHICLTDIRILATNENSTECVYTQGINIAHIDIDGNGIFVLVVEAGSTTKRIVATSFTVTGLATDWRDDNIYWSEGGIEGRIKLVSQATGSDYTLVDKDLVEPRSILLQPLDNYMFWISGSRGFSKVERAELDGSSRSTKIPSAVLTNPISLTSDKQTRRLYFIDDGYVKTCDPDGNGLKRLEARFSGPKMVVLYKNYLIVADSGIPSVLKTMDKTDTLNTYTRSELDIDSIKDMKVLDASLQQDQRGPCDVLNGDCEQICIPIGRNRICQCEYGYLLEPDKNRCSSETLQDNFLLVADETHNKIYQVPLENGEIRAVDTEEVGSPVAVAYDHVTQSMVWSTELFIHQLNIKSGEYKLLLSLAEKFLTKARGLAIDYTSGNLFYTAEPSSLPGKGTVAVLSTSGRNKILLQDDQHQLRAIAIDPEDGLMFWTADGDAPFVKRANMDGTEIHTVVPSNIVKWPNGLAIDPKENKLYLTDGFRDIIMQCSYFGHCSIYYTDPGAHMVDIKLLGNYLYYTAYNRVYVTKLHKTNTKDIFRVAENAELGMLVSLSPYSSTLMYEQGSSPCSANSGNGPFSTFCLPRTSGYACACEDGVPLRDDDKTCSNETPLDSSDSPGRTPVTAIAGAAGGALVLIIVVVVIVIMVLKRSRNKMKTALSSSLLHHSGSHISTVQSERSGYDTPVTSETSDSTYSTLDIIMEPRSMSGYYVGRVSPDYLDLSTI